jgi:primary-amine oxidase
MIRSRLRAIGTFLALTFLAGSVPLALHVAQAAGPSSCSSGYSVDEQLANGARWQMCWERRSLEGIVLHHVTYTPPGGAPVEILGRANLAELHVPYDNNGARFFDLSGIGMGNGMLELTGDDCPGGTLLADGSEDVLCQTTAGNGYSYKYYEESEQSTSLSLFSVTALGEYNYVVAWNFDDDGTIRPEIGATGRLQLYGGSPQQTWPMGGGRRAVAHMHNFIWRLDFDVDGPAADRVEELEALPTASRYQLRNTRRSFANEVERRVAPAGFRSWRVRDLVATNTDGHPLSVELLPNTDHVYRGPAEEPFTHNEVHVTRRKPCELLAAGNVGATCGDDVSEFANGESLTNRDLVLWYGTSFHHLPRDEDEDEMHPHWTSFSIVPRDLTAENPTVS